MAATVAAVPGVPTVVPTAAGATGQRFRHTLHERQPVDWQITSSFQLQDEELLRWQLDRALALACDAVGFDEAEPLAMECFRGLVESYMAHFLRSVRRSASAARRRTPVPLDFQVALAEHNLTLRSLLPHLDPPVWDATTSKHPVLSSRAEVLPALQAASPPSEGATSSDSLDAAGQDALIERLLRSRSEGDDYDEDSDDNATPRVNGVAKSETYSERRPANVPAGFPALPSRHTYRARAVFAARERDPQRIRERATDEGRLGEEALRRLAAKQAELRLAREERERGNADNDGREGEGEKGVTGPGAEAREREREKERERQRRRAEAGNSKTSLAGAAGPATRKRKAAAFIPPSAAAAATTPANPRGTVAFRGDAEDAYRDLMAGGAAAGPGNGENADHVKAAGADAGAAAPDSTTTTAADANADGMDISESQPPLHLPLSSSSSAAAAQQPLNDQSLPQKPDSAAPDPADAAAAARDWHGGLNEPVNAERAYWRQAARRGAASGAGADAGAATAAAGDAGGTIAAMGGGPAGEGAAATAAATTSTSTSAYGRVRKARR